MTIGILIGIIIGANIGLVAFSLISSNKKWRINLMI